MAEDAFVVDVGRVAEAARKACEAIEVAVSPLESGRVARMAGRPLVEIVDGLIANGGRETRLGAAEAFHKFEQSIAVMRARVVRALVDEEGLSLTTVANILHVSRQAAARLYQLAVDEPGDGPD